MVVGAVECEVLNGLGGGDFGVFDEVHEVPIGGKVSSGELDHPGRDGCREEQILSLRRPVFAKELKDFLDVFLETLFQHLICLI